LASDLRDHDSNLSTLWPLCRQMTTELVKNRKDARKLFEEDQPIIVSCKTSGSEFNASIQDISGSGIFIKTIEPLSIGQEIAMTFKFPKSPKPIMVTGEVVRTTRSGAAVEFKVFFDK
jgi:hypothetical protein